MNQNFGLTQGQSGMRPATGMRPGTNARPGTNSARMNVAGTGGSLEQQVAVSALAPMSVEGLRTITRTGGTSGGQGRKVMDRSYHIGVLRQKNAGLLAEMQNLQEEEKRMTVSGSVLAQLQQKSKALQEELVQLKSKLANVNLAVEKSATQDVASVKEAASKIRAANTTERSTVDQLFLKAKEAEAEMKKNVAALEAEMQDVDSRIIAEDQDYGMYKEARDSAFAMSDEVLKQQHEIRTLQAKRTLLINQLNADVDKKKAMAVLLGIIKKRREKEELSQQCSISVEEERLQLIHRAKTTRDDIEVVERQMNEIRDNIAESTSRLQVIEEDVKEMTGDNVNVIQELRKKDAEIQEFIESYPEKEKEEYEKIAALEKDIVRILERVSTAYRLKEQMPQENSSGIVQALTQQVEEKKQQVEQAQITHERLQKELLERRAELEKLASLDDKITEELASHAEKMSEQRAESVKFSDIDGLRNDVEQRRKDLNIKKMYLLKLRDNGKHVLNTVSVDYEKRKRALAEDDKHAALSVAEQKLRLLWQSTYALSTYVRGKEKDSNFISTKAECLRIVEDLNLMHQNPGKIPGEGRGVLIDAD